MPDRLFRENFPVIVDLNNKKKRRTSLIQEILLFFVIYCYCA